MCGWRTRACTAAPAAESYLNIPACWPPAITGADAIHPDGFLSENALRRDPEEHGITFIGPTSEHIRIMGDKIEAKGDRQGPASRWCPADGAVTNEAQALKVAKQMGFPVLIKAAAGGGGRGMKVARSADELDIARKTARKAGRASATTASISRSISAAPSRSRFGDGKGNAIHLGERDCSPQRRIRCFENLLARTQCRAAQDHRHDRCQGHAEIEVPRRRHRRVPV